MKQLLVCLAGSGVFVIDYPCNLNVSGLQHFLKVPRVDPCAPDDHQCLALRYFENGRFDQALLEAKRSIRQDGPSGSLYLISAIACVELERIAEAYQLLERGLEMEPDNGRMHAVIREITHEVGWYGLTAGILERHLFRKPNDHIARATLGWVYLESGDKTKGLQMLKDVVASQTSEVFAHIRLSEFHLQNEQVDLAIVILRRALVISPENVRLFLPLGKCELKRKDLSAAATAFEHAWRVTDFPGPTAVHIARYYHESGRRRHAITYYERAVEADANNFLAMNNLAWTYAEEGMKLDRAQSLSLRTVKKDEENVVYLDTYAEVLHRKGETLRAVAIMRQALQIEGETGSQYLYLREQMEKFDAATKMLPASRI